MASPAPRGWSALLALLVLMPVVSSGGQGPVTPLPDLDSSGPTAQLPPPGPGGGGGKNKAPTISGFQARVGPNGAVTFSGCVTDDQPVLGLSVAITGVGILGLPALVDEDGHFRVTISLDPGTYTATAKVTDALGATSSPVQTTFNIP
jgi:hypothetical protein